MKVVLDMGEILSLWKNFCVLLYMLWRTAAVTSALWILLTIVFVSFCLMAIMMVMHLWGTIAAYLLLMRIALYTVENCCTYKYILRLPWCLWFGAGEKYFTLENWFVTLREMPYALDHCRSSSALWNDRDDWFDQCEELMPLCYYWVITAAYHEGATAVMICCMVKLVNSAASRDKSCLVFNPKWIITLWPKMGPTLLHQNGQHCSFPKMGGAFTVGTWHPAVLAAPNPHTMQNAATGTKIVHEHKQPQNKKFRVTKFYVT